MSTERVEAAVAGKGEPPVNELRGNREAIHAPYRASHRNETVPPFGKLDWLSKQAGHCPSGGARRDWNDQKVHGRIGQVSVTWDQAPPVGLRQSRRSD